MPAKSKTARVKKATQAPQKKKVTQPSIKQWVSKKGISGSNPVKVNRAFNKIELLDHLSTRTELQKKSVSAVLEALQETIAGHLRKNGPGFFRLSGLLKMSIKKIPAKKSRKGIHPLTREEMMFKAKPASKKVKILPLKKLKDMLT